MQQCVRGLCYVCSEVHTGTKPHHLQYTHTPFLVWLCLHLFVRGLTDLSAIIQCRDKNHIRIYRRGNLANYEDSEKNLCSSYTWENILHFIPNVILHLSVRATASDQHATYKAITSLPSPFIVKTGTVETHNSADKYEERSKFNEHSSGSNQIRMPENDWNGYAPHCWRPC